MLKIYAPTREKAVLAVIQEETFSTEDAVSSILRRIPIGYSFAYVAEGEEFVFSNDLFSESEPLFVITEEDKYIPDTVQGYQVIITPKSNPKKDGIVIKKISEKSYIEYIDWYSKKLKISISSHVKDFLLQKAEESVEKMLRIMELGTCIDLNTYVQQIQKQTIPLFWLTLDAVESWYTRIGEEDLQLALSLLYTKSSKLEKKRKNKIIEQIYQTDYSIKSSHGMNPMNCFHLLLFTIQNTI